MGPNIINSSYKNEIIKSINTQIRKKELKKVLFMENWSC